MSLKETPERSESRHHPERRSYTGAFVAVFMLLGLLFVSNLYTLSNLNSARQSLTSVQHDLYKRIATLQSMDERLSAKFSMVEDHHAEQMDALKKELDGAARQVKTSSGEVLNRARGMVARVQTEHQREVSDLKKQIAQKADNEAVVLLGRDVSETKADASATQRTVSVLAKDLAVARSELGDLVASDHDDLGGLHQLSDRNSYQFALTKDRKQIVDGIGLILKRTDLKQHRFSLDLIVNDQQIRNQNHNLGQPIIFYLGDTKRPCELVIMEVGADTVKGYISAPRTPTQTNASNNAGS
jgi:hypothetical protein